LKRESARERARVGGRERERDEFNKRNARGKWSTQSRPGQSSQGAYVLIHLVNQIGEFVLLLAVGALEVVRPQHRALLEGGLGFG
jgi:hypothetical protein